MKIRPVEAQLFHADGMTNTTKLIVAIRNFANAPPPQRKKDVQKLYMFLLLHLSEILEP
jgi:hypothetical protein